VVAVVRSTDSLHAPPLPVVRAPAVQCRQSVRCRLAVVGAHAVALAPDIMAQSRRSGAAAVACVRQVPSPEPVILDELIAREAPHPSGGGVHERDGEGAVACHLIRPLSLRSP
jgi:hypothetical protein